MSDAKPPELDITIDTSEDYESITLTFQTENKQLSVGFDIPEALSLCSWIQQAVKTVQQHQTERTNATKH